jgi:hypothetical protein
MTTRKTLNVTLDQSPTPWRVQVPDFEVHQKTRLVLKLTGNAKGGTFPSINDPEKAFYLHKSAPPGVFSDPRPADTTFGLTVDPTKDSVPHDWYYHLYVKLKKDCYETAPPPPSKGRKTKSQNAKGPRASCPRIKNR